MFGGLFCNHFQGAKESSIDRVEAICNFRVATISGHEKLEQVVGSDGYKVRFSHHCIDVE